MEQTDVRLKLLIDTKAQRVLYAEADKKFIDFLLNVLSLPLGAVIRLLKKDGMVGCLGNLYESVETLNESYLLRSSQSKDAVLKPKVLFNCLTKLLPDVGVAVRFAPTFYTCSRSSHSSSNYYVSSSNCLANNISDIHNATCPNCKNCMGVACTYVPNLPSAENQPAPGFVKDLATYIVMDDLTVKHISDFSITTLLKKFNVQDVDSLEERVITLDVDEGVELLEASLQSKTVLTNAFLKRRRSHTDIEVKLSEDVVKHAI